MSCGRDCKQGRSCDCGTLNPVIFSWVIFVLAVIAAIATLLVLSSCR